MKTKILFNRFISEKHIGDITNVAELASCCESTDEFMDEPMRARIAVFEEEDYAITILQSELFEKILFKFHNQVTNENGSECEFWNDMCGIRKEYLEALETL